MVGWTQSYQTLKTLALAFTQLKDGTVTLHKSCNNIIEVKSLDKSLNSLKILISNQIKMCDYNSNGLL